MSAKRERASYTFQLPKFHLILKNRPSRIVYPTCMRQITPRPKKLMSNQNLSTIKPLNQWIEEVAPRSRLDHPPLTRQFDL
jgi:hypothetical protein